MTVQFHFSGTSMTNHVNVIKSGVWTDQAQQDCCSSLIMHALTDIAQKVCKKKKKRQGRQPAQTTKRRVLIETENESIVSFAYIWPGMGGKAHRPNLSPHDRSRNLYKSPRAFFFFFVISLMSPFLLTTPGHPSHHLFAYFHLSLHLGRIQHHKRRQWLPLCVIFSTTQDGGVCLSVSTSP